MIKNILFLEGYPIAVTENDSLLIELFDGGLSLRKVSHNVYEDEVINETVCTES